MIDLKYAVGIDISKSDFKVCISVINEIQKITVKASSSFKNTEIGFGEFELWYKKHYKTTSVPIYFLMEATGVYYENLAWFLHQKKLNVHVVLANKAKKYMQSLGLKSKNDSIDAQGLSRMCAEQSLSLWKPLSKEIYVLRSLTRYYEDLQLQKTALGNQLHALKFSMFETELVNNNANELLELIENQIKNITKEVEKCINNNVLLASKYTFCKSIKGIGIMSFAVIVAETNGFLLFKNIRQLVSYSGLDVVENQSGSRNGKTRISKKGNSHIRRILYMPSLVAIQHNEQLKTFYERIVDKTNIKMKGVIAVQRKLLCLIYTLWTKEEVYDEKKYKIDKSLEKKEGSSLLS